MIDKEDKIEVAPLTAAVWPACAEIYAQGIATGMATFETEVPSWQVWDQGHIEECRLLAVLEDQVVGWAALSKVSARYVYRGVAEVSVYVAAGYGGAGVGSTLLAALIACSERAGYWMLQSAVFPENEASLRLHQKHGFRVVGHRERIGQLRDQWKTVLFLERRSENVGI